jgi:hypothetical protein
MSLFCCHIYESEELGETATTEDYSVFNRKATAHVRRAIKYHNLDAILGAGYRVNSKRGTLFRIWVTQRLRDHLVKGFTAVNKPRLEQRSLAEIENAVRQGISVSGISLRPGF